MSTHTLHIARFPFPYQKDYAITSIGPFFLRRTHRQRSQRTFFDHNCAAQLDNTSYTVYSIEVSSSLSSFPAGSTVERGKQILASRTSGAISLRHCEQLNYRGTHLPLSLTPVCQQSAGQLIPMHSVSRPFLLVILQKTARQ